MGYIYRKWTLRPDVFDLGNQSARTSKCMYYAVISLKLQAIRTKKGTFFEKKKQNKGYPKCLSQIGLPYFACNSKTFVVQRECIRSTSY